MLCLLPIHFKFADEKNKKKFSKCKLHFVETAEMTHQTVLSNTMKISFQLVENTSSNCKIPIPWETRAEHHLDTARGAAVLVTACHENNNTKHYL